MSEQSFTPGPWEVVGQFVRTPFRRGDPNAIGLMVADVRHGIWPPEQHEANARLIAAAPALLEALIELVLYHDVPAEAQDPVVVPLLTAAFAAIAQTEARDAAQSPTNTTARRGLAGEH